MMRSRRECLSVSLAFLFGLGLVRPALAQETIKIGGSRIAWANQPILRTISGRSR
jgi:hypothetical protein